MASFELLAADGPETLWRGFVEGWAVGRGMSPEDRARSFVWPRDQHVQIRERLHGQPLLVAAELADALVDALTTSNLDLRLASRRDVIGAQLEFEFSILSPEEAVAVQALFAVPPVGVHLQDYGVETSVDPEAAGLELRGSVHDFELRGRGTAVGGVAGILELHAHTLRHERIRTRALTLELAP